jgi:uncharacterized NAD(P)/FAD-binding protein YdhS
MLSDLPPTVPSIPPPPDLITPQLANLIMRLEDVVPGDTDALAEVLQSELSFDDIRAFVRFGADNYQRNLLHKTPRVELRLLCWRPGQSSTLHGHGDAACAFRVMRGAATEIVLGERDRVWPPGTVIQEKGQRVHQLMNLGSDSLLTLNAYSPPLPVDGPSSPRGHQVVIIGGGFSGMAVAYHLLRSGGPHVRINLVEKGSWLGRGIAYGVESGVFSLNVPASRMSIDPSEPDDFVRFAKAETTPNEFLSRSLYGDYVVSRVHTAIRKSKAKIRIWRDEAVAVTRSHVHLRGGLALAADRIVLATGLVPRVLESQWDPRVVDAWDECALSTLPRRGRIALLGSGLSALDVIAFLEAQHFDGHVTLVSPRGLLPLPHAASHGPRGLSDEIAMTAPRELRPLMRWVRAHVHQAMDAGRTWQAAMDELRPHVADLYRGLSGRDRARFVRHVRPYWDVLRHRAPGESLERVQRWVREGRLETIAGRLAIGSGLGTMIPVRIIRRDGSVTTTEFDAVVRCLGPALRFSESATPLLRSMLEEGLARDSNGLGLDTDTAGRLLDPNGNPSHRIFALGSLQRASNWETTGVPDIVPGAAAIVSMILSD